MTEPAPTVPPGIVMQQLLSGFTTAQCLYVVAELNVATVLLAGPRTIADLAAATGAHADSLGRVLRYLEPLGVVRLREDTAEITELGKTLADGTPGSVRGMARYWMETHYHPFGELVHTVRTGETAAEKYLGKPFFEWVEEDPRLAQLQNSAMAGGSRVARGDLLDTYRLPPGDVVADVGGAAGILLAELLANEPGRHGIVFDLPQVVTEAEQTLADAGLGKRSEVVGGDFFESVPEADVYTLSGVLHDWDDESCRRILGTIAKTAAPGAKLVLFEIVVPTDDSPAFPKFVDLVMMTMAGGRERTEPEWRALLAGSGFNLDRVVPARALHCAIEATYIG